MRNAPANSAKLFIDVGTGLAISIASDANDCLGGVRQVVVTLGCNGVDLPIGSLMFESWGGVKRIDEAVCLSAIATFIEGVSVIPFQFIPLSNGIGYGL